MLVSSKQIIYEAQRGQYAIGAFNTSDLEITKAIVWAAAKLEAPVIVQTSEKAIAYAGLENIADIVKNEAKKSKFPIALHLDHGSNLDIIHQCLNEGYTSVMFDGSALSLAENIILTRQAVDMAHRANATCEGELGHVSKAGDNLKKLTDPAQVSEFVRETGVDILAVSIGSAHGASTDEKLDIELLKKIRAKTNIPLVLHGASGVSNEDTKLAIQNGICKVNIDTDIRHTFSKAILEINQSLDKLSDPSRLGLAETDPRDIMNKVMAEIQKVVEEKIRLFGSENKG